MVAQLNIKKVIIGSFAVAAAVVTATGLYVNSTVHSLEAAHDEADQLNELKRDLLVIQEEMTGQRAIQAELALTGDMELAEQFEASAERAFARWDTAIARPAAIDLDLSVTLDRIMEIDVVHDTTFVEVLEPAVQAGDTEAILETAPIMQGISLQFKAEIDSTLDDVEALADDYADAVLSARSSVTTALLIASLAAGAVILGLGALMMVVVRRRFDGEINALDEASVDLRRAGTELVEQSDATREELLFVAASSESAAGNIGQLTSSIEDMTGAIRNIATSSAEVSAVASDAVDWTRVTNETVAKLGDSSAEIGEVVEVITSIAEQTNLLALNATIEAARAGEAGKGFAVVANEVKELAKQTSAATDRISARIAAIQTDTADSVKAIDRISEVIEKISELQQSVSAAVEEQHITTGEIGSIVALVVDEVESLSHRVKDASGVAERAAATADGTRARTDAVAHVAASMREFVGLKALQPVGVGDDID